MMKKVILLSEQFAEKEAQLVADEVYYLAGSDSIFVPSEKTSYSPMNVCNPWPNEDGEVVHMTASEAVRAELARFYPDYKYQARKRDFKLLDIQPPVYFIGFPVRGELRYFDLVGAYCSIYRWLWLDQCWPRGVGTLPLWDIAARLKEWKKARNSLIGMSRSHTLTAVRGQKVTQVKYFNRYFNPHLWYAVQAVLHSLANEAIRLGAVYVNTDCYIFRHGKKADRFGELLEYLQFETHRYSGDGYVTGWGSYKVGPKKTKLNNFGERICKVEKPEKETLLWLKTIQA